MLIIQQNWKQHPTDEYDTKEDVVQIEVAPEALEETQERLQHF
jgi:hypothetical protein